MAFTLYQVDATYHTEYWTEYVIGCGCICDNEADANAARLRYEANPKVEKVTVQVNRYGG